VCEELRHRLADAERELPRAEPGQRSRIEEDIHELRRRITEQRQLIDDPAAAKQRTQARIDAAVEAQQKPERPTAVASRAKFVNPPPMTAPSYFQNRHVEIGLVSDFLHAADPRMMTVVGRGGVGKTAMVCRLLKALEAGRLPDGLGELQHHQQALAIARDIGDRASEANLLCNLGVCYAALGQTTRAIELYQQALAIARDIGYREGEALDLVNLRDAHGVVGEWEQAGTYARQAIEVADVIGFAQAQSEARVCLARICLLADDLPAAQHAARDAGNHAAPRDKAMASLLLGIAQLRQGTPAPATHAFAEATAHADEVLRHSSHNYAALDTKALARCGLALTQDASYAAQAIAVFRQARAITTDDGTVTQVLQLFDAIAAADPAGALTPVRPAVASRQAKR
jgi:tetratricopeptide (TPR) repeat protein